MRLGKVFTGVVAGAALSFGATAASASSTLALCTSGQAGCVLPSGQVAAPPVTTAPVGTPVDALPMAEGKSFGILPLLAAIAAIALAIVLLTGDDGDDSPRSP